jgi:hypothetical protein
MNLSRNGLSNHLFAMSRDFMPEDGDTRALQRSLCRRDERRSIGCLPIVGYDRWVTWLESHEIGMAIFHRAFSSTIRSF